MKSEPKEIDLESAWGLGRDLILMIALRFGLPASLARRRTIARRERALMLAWLAPLEHFVRRLLFIAAAAMGRPNAPREIPPVPGIKQTIGRPGFASEDSRDWGVSFMLFEPERRPAKARPSGRVECWPRAAHSALPLAERFEALIRVTENPDRYAKRLAQRLRAKPARVRRLIRSAPRFNSFARDAHRALSLTHAPTRKALIAYEDSS